MDMAYFIINNVKYIFDYNKYRFEIYKLINNEKYSLTDEERAYFNNILKKSRSYIFNSEGIDNIIASNSDISNNNDIVTLIKDLENIIPEKYRNNLYENLKTFKIVSVPQEKLGKDNVYANYDAKTNVIMINYDNSGIKNNDIKLKEVIFHELLHMASSHYDKEKDFVYTGFHTIDLKNDDYYDIGRGLTEGLTEYLTYSYITSIDHRIPRSNSYIVEQKIIEQLICILGEDVVLDIFYNNKGIGELKNKLSLIEEDRSKIASIFINVELDHIFREEGARSDALASAQSELIDIFDKKFKSILVDAYVDEEINKELRALVVKYNLAIIDKEILTIHELNPNNYDKLDESAKKFYSKKSSYDTILPSFKDDDIISSKRMGYIKISILAVATTLLCLSLLILGITFK